MGSWSLERCLLSSALPEGKRTPNFSPLARKSLTQISTTDTLSLPLESHSGCSTFLKTLANETHGFFVSDQSKINYRGVSPEQMAKDFAGEAI